MNWWNIFGNFAAAEDRRDLGVDVGTGSGDIEDTHDPTFTDLQMNFFQRLFFLLLFLLHLDVFLLLLSFLCNIFDVVFEGSVAVDQWNVTYFVINAIAQSHRTFTPPIINIS